MSNDNDNFPVFEDHPADPSLREALVAEMVSLAESGEIKYTAKYIRKAGQEALEKMKRDYDRKQLDEANEFISDSLISKFSELMDNLNMIENTNEMEKELSNNQLVKRDLKNIIGRLTPYIPLVGLLCGGVIVGKYVFRGPKESEHEQTPNSE